MSKIPSDITTAEAARQWLRVNGYSAEKTDALVAEWVNSSPAPAPVVEEAADEVVEEEEAPTSMWKSKKK
jgi:hypothetical protein